MRGEATGVGQGDPGAAKRSLPNPHVLQVGGVAQGAVNGVSDAQSLSHLQVLILTESFA